MINEQKKALNDAMVLLEEAEKLMLKVMTGELDGSKDPEPVIEEPSSVEEPEPAGDPASEVKEYRDDLKCPHCQSIVYDNRPRIDSGEYSKGSPHFKCSNNTDCPAKVPSNNGGFFGKGWWVNSQDLPQEWLDGEKLMATDGREVDRPVPREPSDDKESPF